MILLHFIFFAVSLSSSFVLTGGSSPPPNPLNCSSSSSAIIINHTTCESCATNYSCQDPSYNATDFISPWMCIFNGQVVDKCYADHQNCSYDCYNIFGVYAATKACVRSSPVDASSSLLSYIDPTTNHSVSFTANMLCNKDFGDKPAPTSSFETVNFNYCPFKLEKVPFSANTTCNFCQTCAFSNLTDFNADVHYCYKYNLCFRDFDSCSSQCGEIECLPVEQPGSICDASFNQCPLQQQQQQYHTRATCQFCISQCHLYNNSYLSQLEYPFTAPDDTHVCINNLEPHDDRCFSNFESCKAGRCNNADDGFSCVPTSRFIQLRLQNPKKLWKPYQSLRNDFCLMAEFNNCAKFRAANALETTFFATCHYCLTYCETDIILNTNHLPWWARPVYNRRTGLCFASHQSCFNDNITNRDTMLHDCVDSTQYCNISIPYNGTFPPTTTVEPSPSNPPLAPWTIGVIVGCVLILIIFGAWRYKKFVKEREEKKKNETAPLIATRTEIQTGSW